MNVVGLDLSLTATGIADAREVRTISFPKLRAAERLVAIRDAVLEVVHWTGADFVVIEGYAYGRPNQAAHLGELGGVVRVALYEAGVPFVAVAPTTLKRYATGKGNSPKDQVLTAAVRLGSPCESNDEADAWWLYAMGRDAIGDPVVTVPKANRAALGAVEWGVALAGAR